MRFAPLLLALAVLAASCTGISDVTGITNPVFKLEPRTAFTSLDMRPFEGFLFTPELYPRAFESRGQILVEAWGGAERKDIYEPAIKYTDVDPRTILSEVYRRARELDADAVMFFRIEHVYEAQPVLDKNGDLITVRVDGYKATGWAIDRLDN